MLLPLTPLVYRKRKNRQRPRRKSAPPAPAELVLESATVVVDDELWQLTLTFDRAIALVDFDGAAITVSEDVALGLLLNGVGAVAITSPNTLVVTMVEVGPATGPGVVLNATALSGIVAMDDGGTWGGAVDLGLPFP
jgi:hypothetical protein